ncbi:GNAT family N-acetyltransferase [Arenimonas sp. MALMAid1274]|uniref:GNAT family N-acetyltransferase n=1 Tax=Arenimonas sp. MALMAid1274 TaxID=3411630 RepID=UPI003BA206BF
MPPAGLAAFPPWRRDPPTAPARLAELGYRLRPARDEDLPRLAELYADSRADELAVMPWPEAAKRSFLAQQFALQHSHYLQHYADADFLVIQHGGEVQGRYYLQRAAPDHLVVDISLFAAHRGRGLGQALLAASQHEAGALGRGMALHVYRGNPRAQALYERLGFVVCDSTDTHHRMHWSGEPVPAVS